MLLFSCFSHFLLFATLWTVACQTPLSMGFSRQEYWSGLLFLSAGDLPNPGIKPMSPAFAGGFFFFFTAAPLGKTLSQKWPYFLKICLNQVRPTHCYLLIYIYIYIYTLSLLSSLFSSQFTCWGNWIICPLKFAILHFAGGTEVYFSKSDLSLTITNILN